MVKPKLTFFEMQVEGGWAHATKANQPTFGMPPEPFDPIDMSSTGNEFITAMIDPKMFAITNIDQAVITAPAIGINDAFQFDFAAYHRLERSFRAIWNDFRIDVTVPLKDAKDDRFTQSTTASFAFDTTCSKERFVDFNFSRKGGLGIAIFDQSQPDRFQISIDGIAAEAG